MKRLLFLLFAFLIVSGTALGQRRPEWIDRLPFTEDAYWGVGSGLSTEQAERDAKRDILLQLNTRVQAAVSTHVVEGAGGAEVRERIDAYFKSNRLRGAEVQETYREADRYWVLLKYCDECGEMLMNSAVNRYEDDLGYNNNKVLDTLSEPSIDEAVRVQRRLQELDLADYRSEDISAFLDDRRLIIRVVNFLPSQTTLTNSQRDGLRAMSNTLFQELEAIGYESIDVVGHANPTGVPNEGPVLMQLSRDRAATLAGFLRDAGLRVDDVSGRGGEETIGDVTTDYGKGRNRRVEVFVHFE